MQKNTETNIHQKKTSLRVKILAPLMVVLAISIATLAIIIIQTQDKALNKMGAKISSQLDAQCLYP